VPVIRAVLNICQSYLFWPVAAAMIMGVWMPALAGEPLPKIYIDKGACPFECCTYRRWSVLADTVLFDRPEGTQPVARVLKGQWVTAATGEVHLVPMPMKVVFEHGRFHVGDQAYLLTNEGEGVMKVWRHGAISEEDVWFVGDSKWQDWGNAGGRRLTCAHPSKECWGRIEKLPGSDWWILIKTPAGKRGWTREDEHFGNMDACGSPG
jgi:hypothetical protein